MATVKINMQIEIEYPTLEEQEEFEVENKVDYVKEYKKNGIALMNETFEQSNLQYEGILANVITLEVVE